MALVETWHACMAINRHGFDAAGAHALDASAGAAMTIERACLWLTVAGVAVASLSASYALARIGEPQSVWLWCSILRAC